jgi:hypothetical protein
MILKTAIVHKLFQYFHSQFSEMNAGAEMIVPLTAETKRRIVLKRF